MQDPEIYIRGYISIVTAITANLSLKSFAGKVCLGNLNSEVSLGGEAIRERPGRRRNSGGNFQKVTLEECVEV